MNVTLNFYLKVISFFKDFIYSMTTIDKSYNLFQIIGVTIFRLFYIIIIDLIKFLFSLYKNNQIISFSIIFFLFEEFILLYTFPILFFIFYSIKFIYYLFYSLLRYFCLIFFILADFFNYFYYSQDFIAFLQYFNKL